MTTACTPFLWARPSCSADADVSLQKPRRQKKLQSINQSINQSIPPYGRINTSSAPRADKPRDEDAQTRGAPRAPSAPRVKPQPNIDAETPALRPVMDSGLEPGTPPSPPGSSAGSDRAPSGL